jgi:hypothetical protein
MYEEKRKGLFTQKEQDFIATALFFWLQNKIKSRIYRLVGLKVCKIFVGAVDDYGLDRIPQQWKLDVIPIVSAAMDGQKEKVEVLVVELMNRKIDIPKIDEQKEYVVFNALAKLIVSAIDYFLQKKG